MRLVTNHPYILVHIVPFFVTYRLGQFMQLVTNRQSLMSQVTYLCLYQWTINICLKKRSDMAICIIQTNMDRHYSDTSRLQNRNNYKYCNVIG